MIEDNIKYTKTTIDHQKWYNHKMDNKTLDNIPDTSKERKEKLIEITKFIIYINKKSMAKYIQAFEDNIDLWKEIKNQSFSDKNIADANIISLECDRDEKKDIELEKIKELEEGMALIQEKEDVSVKDYLYYIDDVINENTSIFQLQNEGDIQFVCGKFKEVNEKQ